MKVPSYRLFKQKITELSEGKLGKGETAVRATADGQGNNIAETYATRAYVNNLPPGYHTRIHVPGGYYLYNGKATYNAGLDSDPFYTGVSSSIMSSYTKIVDGPSNQPLNLIIDYETEKQYYGTGYTSRNEYGYVNIDIHEVMRDVFNKTYAEGNFNGGLTGRVEIILKFATKHRGDTYYDYITSFGDSGAITMSIKDGVVKQETAYGGLDITKPLVKPVHYYDKYADTGDPVNSGIYFYASIKFSDLYWEQNYP